MTTALKIDVRRQKILEKLNQTGHVYVSGLSRELNVTPVTIRNDLKTLAARGELEIVPGGAIVKPQLAPRKGEVRRLAEKQAIARACAAHIDDGSTLFMNSGTTTLEIARELRHLHNLNIVTSSIAIATELSDVPGFRVILLGGELNVQYGFTSGPDAQDQLAKYQADACILSVDGVSNRDGITTYHADEALIDRMMTQRAQRVIVAADSAKLGRVGFTLLCPLKDVQLLITDAQASAQTRDELQAGGLEIIACDH